MKPPTLAEIEEMNRNGYEAVTLARARENYKRGQEALKLCVMIEAAFAGVRLGGGIGLCEARGLDDYADAETCAALREKDEKEDWRAISTEALNRYNDTLSFFDAEGMRFHLPAFLIHELTGDFRGGGVAFTLTHFETGGTKQFGLLSREQRIAVRTFLFHILQDPDYEFDQSDIFQALDDYWLPPE